MRIQKFATGKNFVLALTISVLGVFILNAIHHPMSILTIQQLSGGHTILNLIPFYGDIKGYEILDAYPSEAITIYKRVLLFDLFFLIPSYIISYTLGFMYLGKRLDLNQKRFFPILIIPFIIGGLNLIEDAFVFKLLNSLPMHLDYLMNICGILSTTKILLNLSCMVLLILGFVRLFLRLKK